VSRDIAYLVKRNGIYAAKYQRANGTWTHHSLHTTKAAEAKVLFAQYRQQLLQHQVLSQNNIVPVPLEQLAEEHLAQVCAAPGPKLAGQTAQLSSKLYPSVLRPDLPIDGRVGASHRAVC
jgi:hypothetical protein